MHAPNEDIASRVTDLEARYAHLERWTDELSRVVADQATTIAALRLELSRMNERLQSDDSPREIADDRPPHY